VRLRTRSASIPGRRRRAPTSKNFTQPKNFTHTSQTSHRPNNLHAPTAPQSSFNAPTHLQHLPQDRVQPGDVPELHPRQPLLARGRLGARKLLRGAGVLLQRLDVQDARTPRGLGLGLGLWGLGVGGFGVCWVWGFVGFGGLLGLGVCWVWGLVGFGGWWFGGLLGLLAGL